MPRRLIVALVCALLCIAVAVQAQDTDPAGQAPDQPEGPTFNLKPTASSTESVSELDEEDAYEPIMPERNLETTVTLGFWDLATTLVSHDNLIYKYTDEDTYFGNVVLEGESAFHPQLRVSYNLYPWFTLEPFFDLSVSEYQSTIRDPHSLTNSTEGGELTPVEELGEYDREKRSNITLGGGVNAMFFPYDYGNFGKGRWHPYVIGGISKVWMSINSDYVDDSAVMTRYSGGAGFRLIADDMVSVRFEMMYHHAKFQFDPASSYITLDEGTRVIPVYEYIPGEGQTVVEEFGEQTLNSMSWALGFTATF